jgi:hypothetical protein
MDRFRSTQCRDNRLSYDLKGIHRILMQSQRYFRETGFLE